MSKSNRMAWALVAVSGLAGVVAVAQRMGTSQAAQAQMGGQNQYPSYTGSLPVAQDQGMGAYQALAKVTAEQAVRAAQAALGTNASPTKVQLGVENGYLIWEVVIGGQEVKVDAGNGQVLHKEAAGQEEQEEKGEHEGEAAESGGEHEN